jgi:hypothetical protein
VNQTSSTSTGYGEEPRGSPQPKFVLSTIHLRLHISVFLDTAFLYGVRHPVPIFFLARHSWRPTSGLHLYGCTHSPRYELNVRLPPRPLGSQHPGDVKCGPLACRDTTLIRLRYPARYPSDLPIAYCGKEAFNTGTHLECSANEHIPFCDFLLLRYPQLRSAHCDDLSR